MDWYLQPNLFGWIIQIWENFINISMIHRISMPEPSNEIRRCSFSMHFFYKPNACFSFSWIDEYIQWNIFIASPNPQAIPLFYGEVGQVVQGLPI